MHIRFSSIIKSCKTIIFQLLCDLFFSACESTAIHWRWKMRQNLFTNLSSLFQQPSDSKIPMLFSYIFILSTFHSINSLEPQKHCYNNDSEGKMDPCLTSGAAAVKEGESRKLQGADTPRTWTHLPGLRFHACAGFINGMLQTLSFFFFFILL